MEPMSMNDGLDGRETVAFGLGAGEVAAVVLAVMAAYAALHSALPGVAAWCLGVGFAAGGAVLAWGRLAGRPLLEWALLLARFLVRTRGSRPSSRRGRLLGKRSEASDGPRGPVVLPVALRAQPRAVEAGTAPAAREPG